MTTRRGLPAFTIKGFGGGLNKAVSSFKLRDDELRDCQNVRVDLKGSLKPRPGLRKYDISGAHQSAGSEIKGVYRYSRSDGTRKTIIQSAGSVPYVDANDGAFVAAGSIPTSVDGFSRFTQWRDTVIGVGTAGYPVIYNPDLGASFAPLESRGAMGQSFALAFGQTVVAGSGNWATGNDYGYRFTIDYWAGDNFLGEGFPLHESSSYAFDGTLIWKPFYGDNYWSCVVTPAATDEINFTKGPFAFPSQARTVNVYRSVGVPTGTTASGLLANTNIIGTNFYYVGSIEVAAYNAAASNDILFTDYGDSVGAGSLLVQHQQFERVPNSRYACYHKDRMWYAWNVVDLSKTYALTGGQFKDLVKKTVTKPSRLYFSNVGEPASVRFQSWREIRPTDGEGITALMSWKNRALFVFKANSITGLYGGDSEIVEGIPDIEEELVDEAVGCIAPNSLALGEGGAIFLSNRGVMYFSGTTPESLQSKLVDQILDGISAERKSTACGIYDNKNRRYVLAISTSDEESAHNNVVLEYDFFTNTWVKHVYTKGNTNVFGFNQFVEMKRGDETPKLLATCDAVSAMATTGGIQILDDVYYENDEAKGVPWNAKTKYFDCNEPDTVKTFMALIVRVKTPQTITVAYDVDEGQVTGSLSVAPTALHTWDEAGLNWETYPAPETDDHFWGGIVQGETLVRFPQNVCGRRLGLTFSGEAHMPDTEIQGFTIKYVREDRDEVD